MHLITACNRTYMGDVGRTYELEVRRPREEHLPFVCHLNFTALGGNYGDIIQVLSVIRAVKRGHKDLFDPLTETGEVLNLFVCCQAGTCAVKATQCA